MRRAAYSHMTPYVFALFSVLVLPSSPAVSDQVQPTVDAATSQRLEELRGQVLVYETSSDAVRSLTEMGPVALPALQQALAQGNVNVRREAAQRMYKMGKDTVPCLVDALRDRDGLVRRNAASSLMSLKTVPEESLPALVDSLRYMHARTEAAEALTMLGDEGFDALAEAARSSDSGIRSAVAQALDKCGPKAVSVLVTLAKDAAMRRPGRRRPASAAGRRRGACRNWRGCQGGSADFGASMFSRFG